MFIKNMQIVALPKNINIQEGKEPNECKIIIEPCYPGYGTTLGNALRRVLISSLEGAAPIGVKIDNASHEFTSIPGLKEDILEFILNLKQLRLKIFSDEIVKLELEIHGKKEIKAADIKKNSLVEIVNPELVLGNITDMAGNLKAEITVAKGMGYEMIENRENKEKEIGYIDMDSIFSPVISAGINIENVRVGKQTNYEKLILSLKTDGTLTPKEAFEKSVQILIDQFSSLINVKKEEKEEEKKNDENSEEKLGQKIEEEMVEEDGVEEKKVRRGRPKKTE